MMKLSDYVAQYLVRRGVRDIFLVSGGGIMHLLDSVGRNPELRYYCNYHEQACAIAAEGYARVTNSMGTCLVTVGPGAVNALAGITGAWYDSLPMLVISGQVRTGIMANFSKIRQMGPQEGNVIEMCRPVTKYAVTVTDPMRIRYELEKADYMANSGRPGPVWIEIPLDVQMAQVDESVLEGFVAPVEAWKESAQISKMASQLLALIRSSRRPIIMGGNGVHISGAHQEFMEIVEKTGIPVVLPYTAKDLMTENHPQFVGVFGTSGQRRANFAVQNSDLVISIASGLCLSKTGFNFAGFAPKAKKVVIDIDQGQVYDQVIKPDLAVVADAKAFTQELLKQLGDEKFELHPKWIQACRHWRERYPIILPEYFSDTQYVNSYVFMDRLSDEMADGDMLTVGNGLDCVSYYQSFKVKPGQKTIISGNWGSMGWDLPLAIGASVGRNKGRVICVTGDGSIQWNVQELLTVAHNSLPVKVFVFNNNGYSAIRATQKTFAEGLYVGAEEGSGVSNPDFEKLAQAYRFDYLRIRTNEELTQGIRKVLSMSGPTLCEVMISPDQWISPRASSYKREDGTIESRPLEDMAPFLPREEIAENMNMFED